MSWEISLVIALLPYAVELTDDVIAAIQRLIAAGAKQQTGDAADLLLASQTLLKLAQQSVETAKPPAA